MVDYYCPWCGGYLYEEFERSGKRRYEIAKRLGECGRPWCGKKQKWKQTKLL